MHYDLDKQKKRTLVKPGKDRPGRAAYSPDNKTIAIAKARRGKKGRTVTIDLFQVSDGKKIKTIPKSWGGPLEETENSRINAYWSPSGNRILTAHEVNDHVKLFTYDFKNNKLTELESEIPAFDMGFFLNVSPLVPDDSGFLSFNTETKKDFYFVEWSGKKHPLKINCQAEQILIYEKITTQGEWKGNKLTYLTPNGEIQIDVDKKQISLKSITKDQKSIFNPMLKENKLSDSLQIISFRNNLWQVRCMKGDSRGRHIDGSDKIHINIFDLKQNKHTTTLEGDYSSHIARPLTISPDGKLMLISILQKNTEWLFVLNDQGKFIAEIDLGKPEQ